MATRLVKEPYAVLDGARLRITRPIIEARQTGERNRTGAHCARLQSDVEIHLGQALGRERVEGGTDRQHFGVGGGVAKLAHSVAGSCDNRLPAVDDDGADRDFSTLGSGPRLFERDVHDRGFANRHDRDPDNEGSAHLMSTRRARQDRERTRKPASRATGTASSDRIAKVIAHAGLCSRREAERWIEAGRVCLNGARLQTPAVTVGPGDVVTVDGRPLPAAGPPRLWRYHKPRGRVTSHRDPQGRPTVFEALPKELGRVISIGRLDLNTEGLLLLTSDGALARHLELPATGWIRRYRVRVHGSVSEPALARLAGGVVVDGVRYGAIEARLERTKGSNAWLALSLREGKNREIRKVLGRLGLEVTRLIRVAYGPFQLGDLANGVVEEVKARVLIDQLGPEKAHELGVATPRARARAGGDAGSGTCGPGGPRKHEPRPPAGKGRRS